MFRIRLVVSPFMNEKKNLKLKTLHEYKESHHQSRPQLWNQLNLDVKHALSILIFTKEATNILSHHDDACERDSQGSFEYDQLYDIMNEKSQKVVFTFRLNLFSLKGLDEIYVNKSSHCV